MAAIDSAPALWSDGSSSNSGACNNRISGAALPASANKIPLRTNKTEKDANEPNPIMESSSHAQTSADNDTTFTTTNSTRPPPPSSSHAVCNNDMPPPPTTSVDCSDERAPLMRSIQNQLTSMSISAGSTATDDAGSLPLTPLAQLIASSRSSSGCSIVVSTPPSPASTEVVTAGAAAGTRCKPLTVSSAVMLSSCCPSVVSVINHHQQYQHQQQHTHTPTTLTSSNHKVHTTKNTTSKASSTKPTPHHNAYYHDKYPAINTTASQQTQPSILCVRLPNADGIATTLRSKRNLAKTQSLDIVDEDLNEAQHATTMPLSAGAVGGTSRPIYPNVPYSPYGSPYVSPYGSPRGRKRQPFRESRRISIEHNESFLQLNQYKLYDKIGQGSYGLVKLAYSVEDSTHYAMKIMSKRKLLRKAGLMGRGPKRGPTTSPLDRVYREIAVLKKLDHPNVVKLVEVLDDPLEDSLYLVFEWVELGAVLSVPTETPLSEERAWSVFRDALLGLEYLHYQHIIHSDLKPDNLLVDKNGRVLIADLGVCNEFDGNDASMSNISTPGTPAFRAPETLQTGHHSYNGRAVDVWALGATLFALVFGNVPFVADNVPALYERIRAEPLRFPDVNAGAGSPRISDALRHLLDKMLAKDCEQRATLPQIKHDGWVTHDDAQPLPTEEENCCLLVDVSEEEISSVVTSIPKLDTLILIKNMLKKHSFQNPYAAKSSAGQARTERFLRAGRSNSAPGAYHGIERQVSNDNLLPPVSEVVGMSERLAEEESLDG